MDAHIYSEPKKYTAVRIRVEERDDSSMKELFDGEMYVCAFEEPDREEPNRHYHIVVFGTLSEAVRQRKTRYGKGKGKSSVWSKENSGTFFKAVSYTTKCGDYFSSDHAEVKYWIEHVPKWEFREGDDGGDIDNKEANKKRDWMLTSSNWLVVLNRYRNKVREEDRNDFFSVLQWVINNTRWNMNKSFMYQITDLMELQFQNPNCRCPDDLIVKIKSMVRRRYDS